MAQRFDGIGEDHRAFIEAQQMFFVATAAPEGRVNLSPKGMDSLRVLGPNRILWLNWTGSGNETAAHLRQSPRMTLMWCAFEGRALILRAYGTARAFHPDDTGWAERAARFALGETPYAARQIFDLAVDLVQTSCGYGVPLMDWRGEREVLPRWAASRGPEGVRRYWAERNALSLDGLPTGIPGGAPEEG